LGDVAAAVDRRVKREAARDSNCLVSPKSRGWLRLVADVDRKGDDQETFLLAP